MAKQLRFKVGDRVTIVRGICIGETGRVVGRVARAPKMPPEWVVRLDKLQRIGSRKRSEVWLDDDEIEPNAAAKSRPTKLPRPRMLSLADRFRLVGEHLDAGRWKDARLLGGAAFAELARLPLSNGGGR